MWVTERVTMHVCVCVCKETRTVRLTNRCWRDEFKEIKTIKFTICRRWAADKWIWSDCLTGSDPNLSVWPGEEHLPLHLIRSSHTQTPSAFPPCAQTAPRVTAGPRPQTWPWPACRNTWWGPGCWSSLPAGGLEPSSLTWRSAGPAVVVGEENTVC